MKRFDCTLSAFELLNDRGYYAPLISFHFTERTDGRRWRVNVGGRRSYVLEYGRFKNLSNETIEEQSVNAHLFIQQVCACLVVIGCGLFKFRTVSRVLMKSVEMEGWIADLRPNDPNANIEKSSILEEKFADWMSACFSHKWMKRALEDMYNSLIYPKEAPLFAYRGMEWIKEGLEIRWEDMPKYLNLPPKEVKKFTRMLNDPNIAARHGTKSGKKLRADAMQFAWSANILEIVNGIRAEREPNYRPLTADEMGQAIGRSAPLVVFD